MENKEQINIMIENIYEDLNEIKILNKLLKNVINSTEYNLYTLQQKIKKETTAQ